MGFIFTLKIILFRNSPLKPTINFKFIHILKNQIKEILFLIQRLTLKINLTKKKKNKNIENILLTIQKLFVINT